MKKLLVLATIFLLSFGVDAPLGAASSVTSTVSWTAPTTFVSGAPIPAGAAITYRVYESDTPAISPGAAGTMLAADGITGTMYTYSGTGCFAVSAIYNGVESGLSNVACKLVPGAPSGCSVK
ncbi:MAG: hypothetical protein M0Z48_00600 [Nitrospiraceae bacterium]|nr:hypothetical protein [Nitrospiraceae bacterium]